MMKSLGSDFKKEIYKISESGTQKIQKEGLWKEWIVGTLYSNSVPSYIVVVVDNPALVWGGDIWMERTAF